MPALPEGWSAEVVLRSAGGASFSGDFLVATRSDDGSQLEVALVDVSGKGVDAGTRALLLSGAFGGLLGSVRTRTSCRRPTATCSASSGRRGSPRSRTS